MRGELYTQQELAERFNVDRHTIGRWEKLGVMTVRKRIGRAALFDDRDVKAIEEHLRVDPTTATATEIAKRAGISRKYFYDLRDTYGFAPVYEKFSKFPRYPLVLVDKIKRLREANPKSNINKPPKDEQP